MAKPTDGPADPTERSSSAARRRARSNHAPARHLLSGMGAIPMFHLAGMPSFTPDVPVDPPSRPAPERHERERLRQERQMLGIEVGVRTR